MAFKMNGLTALVILQLLCGAVLIRADDLDELIGGLNLEDQDQPVNTVPPLPLDMAAVCPPGQRCVQKVMCSNFSTTGENLIDIRFSKDNPCVNYLLQCCYEDDIVEVPPSPPETTDKPVVDPGKPRATDPPPVFESCGKRNPKGVGFRIVEAHNLEAEYGEFPWVVALLEQDHSLGVPVNKYICAGSLIHPKVVLTAVHCVKTVPANRLTVLAGEWDTKTTFETYPTENRSVAEIVMHPDYYRGGLHNDVALLFLDHPLELNEVIQTVCLPPQDTLFDHERCFVAGWGKDKFGQDGVYQTILKKVEVPVVPWDTCQTMLRNTRLKRTFELHKSFICAGGEAGKDACKGDGGGPLMCAVHGSDIYAQAGIVAWGIGCGEPDIPGVYAAVAKFRHWIDQQMANHQLQTTTYETY